MPEYEFPDMQIFCLLSSPNTVLVTQWNRLASSHPRKAQSEPQLWPLCVTDRAGAQAAHGQAQPSRL